MIFCIKRTFNMLLKNPQIPLLYVIFLLIIQGGLVPLLILSAKSQLIYFVRLLSFLFIAAFFAGWFGMIKYVVTYKGTGNVEEDIKNRYNSFKEGFFSSVANYILPVAFYIILFVAIFWGFNYILDMYSSEYKEIVNEIHALANNADALSNFITTLPKSAVYSIAIRNFIFIAFSILFALLTFYSVPALFFNTKTNNPLTGLKNGFLALLKKTFSTSFLLFGMIILSVILFFIQAISIINPVLSFIALVVKIYFTCYIIMLIFLAYERNFTGNSYNGCNCIGENGSCN